MFEGLLQPTHLLLILVLVLIFFGPGKLPELGKALGQSVRELRDSAAGSPRQATSDTSTTSVEKPETGTP